jgi:hypothetical protein
LKGVLSQPDISYARSCFDNDKIDYNKLSKFINNAMLDTCGKILNWEPVCAKYRVSNNNNSDASTFHRDIICKDPNLNLIPSFTCLSYLDKTVMELIPDSHDDISMSITNSFKKFFKTVKLVIEPGDMLVFYSTMLHRGIFTENLPNRRLIQLFEVFPSRELYNTYGNQILHVPGKEKSDNFLLYASRIRPVIDILNLINYFNASTGYGITKNGIFKKCNSVQNFKYLSSEGTRGRLIVSNGFQDINKYILLERIYDLPDNCYDEFMYVCFIKNSVIFIIVLFLIIFGIYKYVYKK